MEEFPNLPVPMGFKPTFSITKETNQVKLNNEVTTAVVDMLVILKSMGAYALPRFERATYAPNEKPYFLVRCQNFYYATFYIVTDGETFWPADKDTHRLTSVVKPRASINMEKMTEIDQQLIQLAIQMFITGSGEIDGQDHQERV